MKRQTVIIAGAGPAGLTAARELLRANEENSTDANAVLYQPIVVEEADFVGGISATREYNGNRMDMGGHRFFSKNEDVVRWWTDLLPVQATAESAHGPDPQRENRVMLIRNRVSRIFYLRKFFDYPITLKPQTFANMGFSRTMRAGIGYLGAKIAPRPEYKLEDFLVNRFGEPLYHLFFEDYTKKVWGKHPSELSADWGAQRIKGLSMGKALAEAIRTLLVGKKGGKGRKQTETSLIEWFYYPKLGPGQLWQAVADDVTRLGGQIRLSQRVVSVQVENGRFVSVRVERADGTPEVLFGDFLVSSMPVKDLVGAIRGIDISPSVQKIASELPYRDFMTVGLLVNKLKLKDARSAGGLIPDCWIYVQERDVKLGRLQLFNNWSPYLVKDPANSVWMGLEYFCDEGDEDWNMPDEEFIRFARGELVKLGIVDDADVLDAVRIKVKKAYPAYFGSYERFGEVRAFLDFVENLFCIGRNGQHRYNNMDHSMLTAMEAVRLIRSGATDKTSVWAVNSEEDYHESKGTQAR